MPIMYPLDAVSQFMICFTLSLTLMKNKMWKVGNDGDGGEGSHRVGSEKFLCRFGFRIMLTFYIDKQFNEKDKKTQKWILKIIISLMAHL